MPKKLMPVAERQRENEDSDLVPPPGSSHNRPDTGASQAPSPFGGADVGRWADEVGCRWKSSLKGKLDAMASSQASAIAGSGDAVANGPDGGTGEPG